MPEQTKSAGANGGPEQFIISNWKEHNKNTLRGFFTITLPSGIVINNCSLHDKGGSRWIGLPSSQFKKHDGTTVYARLVEFASKEDYAIFQSEALRAVDGLKDGQDE